MVFGALSFVMKAIISGLYYLTNFFNVHSRERRYISFVLDKEKVRLKTVMEEVRDI